VSIYRRAKKRDANEPEIVQALRKAGAVVWYQDRPFDLLVGFMGRLVALEVKTACGKLKPSQIEALAESVIHGLPFYVVRSPEEALAALVAQPRALHGS
jgi:predicted nuclease of predicted toxin-antitoxin system